MEMDCKILVPEDFVLNIVSNSRTRKRYEQYAFNDYVDVSIVSLVVPRILGPI